MRKTQGKSGWLKLWEKKRWAAFAAALMMCFFCCVAQAEPQMVPGDGAMLLPEGVGMISVPGLTKSDFDMEDLPEDYLTKAENGGRVIKISYVTYSSTSTMMFPGMNNHTSVKTEVNKSVMVYLPAGYDTSEERYNIIYLLHGAQGSMLNYFKEDQPTQMKYLLDHMIEDGVIEPVIVVAATYFTQEEFMKSLPLVLQVELTKNFPDELVEDIIPAVESQVRTYAEDTTLEGIVASRDHRCIAGFSLGGVAAWNTFLKQMQAFKWYLPISQASWDDGEDGLTGIMNSDISAETLYEAVKEQGYGPEDFMLFVATGSDDDAFEYATNQMKSLLEYDDMFKVGENTSCSMMSNGTHTIKALYTYMYHILPSLFVESTGLPTDGWMF